MSDRVYQNKRIEKMRRRQERGARLVLFFNKSANLLLSPFRWIAWRLWGKRRAIRRMQELAGLLPPSRKGKAEVRPAHYYDLPREDVQDEDTGLN